MRKSMIVGAVMLLHCAVGARAEITAEPTYALDARLDPTDRLPVTMRRYQVDGAPHLAIERDPRTGHLEALAEAVPVGDGQGPRQSIRLDGSLDSRADPPQMEVELVLMDGKCSVLGRARRVGP